jgi:GNAT superfamily N-acetyltransferase
VTYSLEAYAPSDRDDYVGLLGEAWGHQGLSGEEFDWWFERNPAGSLMSVARAGGRVVGVAAHTLLRMAIGGEERLASFSVHATTEPAWRGRGIFAGLEAKHEREAAERGVAVALGFASAPTAPIFLGPLGWTEIGRLRIWARPVVGARDEDEPHATSSRIRCAYSAGV